ncbi:putative DNA binding domain-containing protein [bacterium]|nr:putative DNA binding domain-containing protein [bacterium]
MDKQELTEIIEKGEDSFTEFKEERVHPDDLAAGIVAFANTEGGNLMIGVSDDGKIVGVSDLDKEMQRIDNICANNCEPTIYAAVCKLIIEDKKILIVKIPKGPQRPYRTNRGVHYIRTASGRRIAGPGELALIHQASGALYYDELPVANTSIKDIRPEYFEEFLERFLGNNIENLGIKAEDLLKNMRILTSYEGDLVTTIGGLLFFGKKPEHHLPYCKVTIVRFFGNDIGETFEKKDIEGRLIDQIERAEIILKDYLRSKTKIEGFKKEEPCFEIPIESLREAVINAVAHRNYQLPSQIRIFIFDNRIEIKSPGKLPNTLTIANIKLGFPLHRNPLIVSFLAKEHRMTEIGTGIPRMIRLIKEHTGREPDFEERDHEFIVRIRRPDNSKVEAGLDEA